MNMLLLLTSCTALLVTTGFAVVVLRGMRRLRQLSDQPPAESLPSLSVVVPARNEADELEPALRSLLEVEYPEIEIIAVNDRSTDATAEVLERLTMASPRLRVFHVTQLPPGWLGKTHALHIGAQQARGAFLLFTDADVRFHPLALRRAVAYAARHQLEHLVVMPEITARGPLLRAVMLQFLAAFLFMFRPWRVHYDPKRYVGVGAFNLVSRSAYRAIGGHKDLAMTPLDDLLLAKRLKQAGARSDALLGSGMVALDWYASTAAMVRGMEKNAFAAVDYRLGKLVASTGAVVMLGVWPWLGLVVGSGSVRGLCALTLLSGYVTLYDSIRRTDWPRWILLLTPLATLVGLYLSWRAALLALSRGAIEWRGTRYSLSELRARHF